METETTAGTPSQDSKPETLETGLLRVYHDGEGVTEILACTTDECDYTVATMEAVVPDALAYLMASAPELVRELVKARRLTRSLLEAARSPGLQVTEARIQQVEAALLSGEGVLRRALRQNTT